MRRHALLLAAAAAALAGCTHIVTSDPAAAAGATRPAIGPDAQRLLDIAQTDVNEIAAGRLGLQKAELPAVRAYSERIVDEHNALLGQARELARAHGVPLPKLPDLAHQGKLSELASLPGFSFDRAYLEQLVQDHSRTLALLQKVAEQTEDPALRTQSEMAIPHVQEHLDIARRLQAEVPAS